MPIRTNPKVYIRFFTFLAPMFIPLAAVLESALNQNNGVVGIREDTKKISLINFEDIRGGKPFNVGLDWFNDLLKNIKQII